MPHCNNDFLPKCRKKIEEDKPKCYEWLHNSSYDHYTINVTEEIARPLDEFGLKRMRKRQTTPIWCCR